MRAGTAFDTASRLSSGSSEPDSLASIASRTSRRLWRCSAARSSRVAGTLAVRLARCVQAVLEGREHAGMLEWHGAKQACQHRPSNDAADATSMCVIVLTALAEADSGVVFKFDRSNERRHTLGPRAKCVPAFVDFGKSPSWTTSHLICGDRMRPSRAVRSASDRPQ